MALDFFDSLGLGNNIKFKVCGVEDHEPKMKVWVVDNNSLWAKSMYLNSFTLYCLSVEEYNSLAIALENKDIDIFDAEVFSHLGVDDVNALAIAWAMDEARDMAQLESLILYPALGKMEKVLLDKVYREDLDTPLDWVWADHIDEDGFDSKVLISDSNWHELCGKYQIHKDNGAFFIPELDWECTNIISAKWVCEGARKQIAPYDLDGKMVEYLVGKSTNSGNWYCIIGYFNDEDNIGSIQVRPYATEGDIVLNPKLYYQVVNDFDEYVEKIDTLTEEISKNW